MIDVKTISLPETMPLPKRISEAARQIRAWVHSYENESDHKRAQLRLVRCIKKNGMFRYTYEFLSKASESLPDKSRASGGSDS